MVQEDENTSLPLVLVVDDDPLMRLFHTKLLEDIARIREATNTYDAEDMMRQYRPALVLLDDIMPNCPTGLGFLEKAKKDEELADIPIIMVTASNKQSEIMRGLQAGAAAYVTKPVDATVLFRAVQAELDKRNKIVWIVMQDQSLTDELEELFVHFKCDVFSFDGESVLDSRTHGNPPDLIIVARTSDDTDGRKQFDKIRAMPTCRAVPMLLVGEAEAEGEGLNGPADFLCAPVAAQEIALQSARLIRAIRPA